MQDRSHRVALLGAGRIAAVHLGYLRGVRTAEVVAVCDADPARARAFAEERKIPAYFGDLGEMFRQVEPSVVHVVTPPTTHAQLAIEAMESGANVVVEKPMAMTVEDCDRMIAAAERYGRRLCVDHNRLFDPVILRARKLVDQGRIGEVVGVEAHQGVNAVELGSEGAGAAHWSVADAFAPLYNLGPHPLYLASAFIGPTQSLEVMSPADRGSSDVLRELRIMLQGENALGYVAFSMGAQPYLNHLAIYGTKATLRVNLNTMTLIVEQTRRLPKLVAKLAANVDPAAQLLRATMENVAAVGLRRMKVYPGIGELIRRFYRNLDEGLPAPVDGDAGRENVRLLRAIENALSDAGDIDSATNGRAKGTIPWTS
jgi:predicted dehydrogenase